MKHLILLSLLITFAGCTKNMEYGTETVTYIVEGPEDYSVTYYDGECGFEEAEDVNGKWQYSFTRMADSANNFSYLSAQNGYNTGTLTIKILINGKVVKQKSCTGYYCLMKIEHTSGCDCR